MHSLAAAVLVFLGGFIVMVIEIVGAWLLRRYFGSSYLIWVCQIGVVLVALALGYYLGGALADRWRRLAPMAWLLIPAGAFTFAIPPLADRVLNWIVARHPVEKPVPEFWQKFDPVMGSALVFLLPCVVLAMLSPYMIRLATRSLAQLGRQSGLIIAVSTVGSIAGVFISGFVLIEHMKLSNIFRVMGGLTILLGGLCIVLDRRLTAPPTPAN
jgi:MFS family permease